MILQRAALGLKWVGLRFKWTKVGAKMGQNDAQMDVIKALVGKIGALLGQVGLWYVYFWLYLGLKRIKLTYNWAKFGQKQTKDMDMQD